MAAEAGGREEPSAPPPPLAALPPDALAAIAARLDARDVARLALTCNPLSAALARNEGLWAATLARRFPPAWLVAAAAERAAGGAHWRDAFFAAHSAAHELRAINPPTRRLETAGRGDAQLLLMSASASSGVSVAAAFGSRLCFARLGGRSDSVGEKHKGGVTALLALPSAGGGAAYASASADQTVRLWAPPAAGGAAAPVRTLRGHTEGVLSLAIAADPGGNDDGGAPEGLLLSGSADRTVRVWSAAPLLPLPGGAQPSQPQLSVLRGHGGAVQALLALSVGSAVSGGADCRLKLWDIPAATCAATAAAPRGQGGTRWLLPAGGGATWAVQDRGAALLAWRCRPSAAASPVAALPAGAAVERAAASPGGLLACAVGSRAYVIDARVTGRPLHVLADPARRQLNAGLQVDRFKLVAATARSSGGGEAPITAWSIATGEQTAALGPPLPLSLPGGARGAAASAASDSGGEGEEEDLTPPPPPPPRRPGVSALTVAGARVLAAERGSGALWLWDFGGGGPPPRQQPSGERETRRSRFWLDGGRGGDGSRVE